MNETFYITKGIHEAIDPEVTLSIKKLINDMQGEVDYLQVFHISQNLLTHSQEIPFYEKVYMLNNNYQEVKIFCIRTEESNFNYWTIMLAEEY